METQSILFVLVMAAIGVVGLVAFLIFLIAQAPFLRRRGAAGEAASGTVPRPQVGLLAPGLLALLVVIVAVLLLLWLFLANSEMLLPNWEADARAITFFVIMAVIAVAGLVGFLIYIVARGGRAPARDASPAESPAGEARPAVETPSAVRLMGLLILIVAFLLLCWVYVSREIQQQLMLHLIYPAAFAVAVVMLFDKATRTWSPKGGAEILREWIFCNLFSFLLVLGFLNLFQHEPRDDGYGALFWDMLGIVLFFFAFWMMDRKVTRHRFLVGYGYLAVLPLLLFIWTAVEDVPATLAGGQPAIFRTRNAVDEMGRTLEALREETAARFEALQTPASEEEAPGDGESAEDDEPEASPAEEEEIVEEEIPWWSTIWPFFFLAVIFFVAEIISLVAAGESEHHAIGIAKDLGFAVLYFVLLLIAMP